MFQRRATPGLPSAVDDGHVALVVALAGGRGEVVELLDLGRAQLDAVGRRVLFDAGDALGAGDRGDVVALRKQPGQRDLRRCPVELGSDGLDLVDDAEVLLEVALEWDRVATETVAILRSAAGRDPHNRDLSDLVWELATQSEAFRTRWASHNVRFHNTGVKEFHHPVVGELTLSFNRLDLAADPGLTLFTYTAEPGSRSEEALGLLGSWAATLDPAELVPETAQD